MRVAVVAAVAVVVLLSATPPVAHAQSDGLSTDGVTIDVYVEQSGDATWNVSTAFALESAEDRTAFRRLADDVENGSNPPGFDADTAAALVAAADERTGRPMSLGTVQQSARIVDNGSLGVVTLSFSWSGFATTDGDTVAVGDAFGEWTLSEDQRLRIHPPPNFGLLNVDPDADGFENGTLTWTGERAFGASEPSVTYARSVVPPTEDTTTATETTSATTPTAGNGGSGGPDLWFVAALTGALLLGGVLAYAAVRRDQLFGDGEEAGDDPDAGAAAAAEDEPADAEPEPSEPDPAGGVDPELLSDEERVERLLAERGGRMKQAAIVSETGWSNAKVSQLLSSMEEEDRIEKLRIGRENLISLPDADGEE